MAENYKLKLIYRPLASQEWAKVFTDKLLEELGPDTVTPKTGNLVNLPLVSKRDAHLLQPYPADNPRHAQKRIASRLTPSFMEPLSGVPVDKLMIVPSSQDRMIFLKLRSWKDLRVENITASNMLRRQGIHPTDSQRFLFQICLGYSSERVSENLLEELGEYIPRTVDLAPGVIDITRARLMSHDNDRSRHPAN